MKNSLRMGAAIAIVLVLAVASLSVYAFSGMISNTADDTTGDDSVLPTDEGNGQSQSGDSNANADPDCEQPAGDGTGNIYNAPSIDGFYTIVPGVGDKVSGSDLRTGTSYYISLAADVTDYGLQWFKDGARTVVSNGTDGMGSAGIWLVLDTSTEFVVEISKNQGISAGDISVSGVWGKAGAVGFPHEDGPGSRYLEQVNDNTVRAYLANQPFGLMYPGTPNHPVGPFDSNESAAAFNDKSVLAGYAPMGIYFKTPGEYRLCFCALDSNGNAVSLTTSVTVCVTPSNGDGSGSDGDGDNEQPGNGTGGNNQTEQRVRLANTVFPMYSILGTTEQFGVGAYILDNATNLTTYTGDIVLDVEVTPSEGVEVGDPSSVEPGWITFPIRFDQVGEYQVKVTPYDSDGDVIGDPIVRTVKVGTIGSIANFVTEAYKDDSSNYTYFETGLTVFQVGVDWHPPVGVSKFVLSINGTDYEMGNFGFRGLGSWGGLLRLPDTAYAPGAEYTVTAYDFNDEVLATVTGTAPL